MTALFHKTPPLAAIALLCLLAGGCSSQRGALTVTGTESRQVWAQSFNHAYISHSADGQYDIILIQETEDQKKASEPWSVKAEKVWNPKKWLAEPTPKPLEPLGHTDFRQIVHLHVFWAANGGSVAKDGVVTNATIDWYVIAREAGQPEMLHYEGAGYVMINEGSKAATVQIRDGAVKKTDSKGDMHDPIGPAKLVGKVKAQNNRDLVANILADLKTQTAAATLDPK